MKKRYAGLFTIAVIFAALLIVVVPVCVVSYIIMGVPPVTTHTSSSDYEADCETEYYSETIDTLIGSYIHRYDPAEYDIYLGVDISSWNNANETINWNCIHDYGVDFAIIRAGLRGYGSEGKLLEDKFFHKNARDAMTAGIHVGAYIYSQAITVEEAQEEADLCISAAKEAGCELPIIMDCEFADVDGASRLRDAALSKEAYTEVCAAFCERVLDEGYVPMIYGGLEMLTEHIDISLLPPETMVWVAQYNNVCSLMEVDYDIWQFTDKGSIPGVDGKVDLNFFYKEKQHTEPNSRMMFEPRLVEKAEG